MNWGKSYLYSKPNGTAEALFEPIKRVLEKEKESISYVTRLETAPSFFKQFKKMPGWEAMGGDGGAMGGWLLPRSALTNLTKLSRALETIGPNVNGPAVGNLEMASLQNIADKIKSMHITGHFASPNGNRDLDIGMNPAWRASVMDLIPWEPFEGRSKEAEETTLKRMTAVKMQALRDLAPDSGGYFNEVSKPNPSSCSH